MRVGMARVWVRPQEWEGCPLFFPILVGNTGSMDVLAALSAIVKVTDLRQSKLQHHSNSFSWGNRFSVRPRVSCGMPTDLHHT